MLNFPATQYMRRNQMHKLFPVDETRTIRVHRIEHIFYFPLPVLVFILGFGLILALWFVVMYPVFLQIAEEMPGGFPGRG